MGSAISSCFQEKQENNYLKGKVMMKLHDALRLKREGIIKLENLADHPNYIEQLDDWAAVDRRATDQVYVFSYRHENGVFSDTQSLGKRYMSANYKWALDFMEQKYDEMKDKKAETVPIAWLDILCTCHDNETLQDAFGYMGSLYLNNIVVNNYMKSPETFIQVQSRGWIYQESAFPAIELQEWDDDAWNDMVYYRVVADLILRRGYQAIIKRKA
ncbi:predicted protein [Chaetoceros tenuissimus]|uniref:Uncharacterized protein n=1 Tax=Chaetoceros tenuissimus TaxID=426638 RepID=A0AAD3H748_9STRA|nr:predicted protein [Chaetoceros tenuissimus]